MVAELQKDDLKKKVSTACFVRVRWVSDDPNQLFILKFDETTNIYCNLLVPPYFCFRPFPSISTAHDSYKIASK